MIDGLAVLYPTEVVVLNKQPWQSTMGKTTKNIPGRIIRSFNVDDQFCTVILFESGSIKRINIESLKVIPEVSISKEESRSYVVDKDNRYYLRDNYLHREDGPAIEGIFDNKNNKFFLEGVEYTPEGWLDTLPEEKQTEMLFHLDKIGR